MRVSSFALLASVVVLTIGAVAPSLAAPMFRLGLGGTILTTDATPPDGDTNSNDDGNPPDGSTNNSDPIPPPGSPLIVVADLVGLTFDGHVGVESSYKLPEITGGTGSFTYRIAPSVAVSVSNGYLTFTPPMSGDYIITVMDSVGVKAEIPVWVPPEEIHGFSHRGFSLAGTCRPGPEGAEMTGWPGYPIIGRHNLYCTWLTSYWTPAEFWADPYDNSYTTYWYGLSSLGPNWRSTTYYHYARNPGYTGPIDFTWYE